MKIKYLHRNHNQVQLQGPQLVRLHRKRRQLLQLRLLLNLKPRLLLLQQLQLQLLEQLLLQNQQQLLVLNHNQVELEVNKLEVVLVLLKEVNQRLHRPKQLLQLPRLRQLLSQLHLPQLLLRSSLILRRPNPLMTSNIRRREITKGTTGIWESKDNICGTKAIFIVDDDGTFLSILLSNNTFLLYQLSGTNWNDITSQKHDISRLKFFTDSDKELTKSDYSVTIIDYSYRFTFNSGVNCKKIKLGDDDVWKNTDDAKFATIKFFQLGLISNNFFVYKNDSEYKKIDFKPKTTPSVTQPKATPTTPSPAATTATAPSEAKTTTPPSGTVSEPTVTQASAAPVQAKAPEPTTTAPPSGQVTPTTATPVADPATPTPTPRAAPSGTPVTLDIDKTQSTPQFEYSRNEDFHKYEVKSGYYFNKVTQKNTVVWETKDNLFGTLVRTKVTDTEKFVAILLHNFTFRLFHQQAGGSWKDITAERYDVTKIKFYGENDNPLKSTDYIVTLVNYSYEFAFKTGVNCKKIKYGDDDVWKHTDDPKFASIKFFQLGLVSNNFFLINSEPESKKIEFKPSTQPKATTTATSVGEPAVSPTAAPLTEAVVAAVAPQTQVARTLDIPKPAKVKVSVEAPTGKARPKRTPVVEAEGPRFPVPVNINLKESNSTVNYSEDYLKNVMIYTPKVKYIFNQIVFIKKGSGCCGSNCCESEKVIWETSDPKQFFERVYVDGLGSFSSTRNFSIHFCDGTVKHFNKPSCGGDWSEAPNLIDLDIRITNSDISVDFSKKDSFRTFTAKPGYTIRRIRKPKCGSDCCGENVIWESLKDNAVKVVLVGFKNNPKHLCILLETGEPVFLYKNTGGPWQDVTSAKNKLTDLRLYALADGNKLMEMHQGYYSVALFNSFYGFVFFEEVCCVKVVHNEKNLWDTREEKEFGNLKGVFLDVCSNKFNVINDDDRCGVCEEEKKVKAVTLDINGKASTDDFDYNVDHHRNIKIFIAKGNAMFNQVIKRSSTTCCWSTCCQSEEVIWEINDPTKLASKVFTDGFGPCSSAKNVTIYLMNGEILHYHKGGRKKPWRETSHKIGLYVNRTSSTIEYDFHHDGEKRTFTAKPGYLFNKVFLNVGLSCKMFWEARIDKDCSTKVVVYGVESTIKNINIFMKNGSVKHFHKVGKEWISTTPFVLDIDKNKDNDQFDYRSTRGFGHFNPKANLTVEKIVKTYKSNCCVTSCWGSECCGSIDDLVIWTAKPEDQGLKVVLMGAGKEEKHISVLLQSGNFVLLNKCGKGECWQDITKDKHNFSGVKMFSLDEGTSKHKELTTDDYEPIVYECRYGYEVNDSVKCVMITNNNVVLWSHTSDPEFGYPKGLYLDLLKNQFIVTSLKGQTRELTKPEVRKVISVTLDIDKTETTSDFEHSKSHKFHKYIAKPGRLFTKVIQGTTDVWNAKNLYGTMVGTKSKDNESYVIVVLENGDFKLLHQPEGGKWTDITNKKGDVTKLKFYSPSDDALSPSDYSVIIMGHYSCFTFSYKFDCGVKCKTVVYGKDTIWDENKCCSYKTIKRFDFDPVGNIFYAVKNSCDYKKIDYEPAPTPDKVEPVRVRPVTTPVTTTAVVPTTVTPVTAPVAVTEVAPAVTAPAKPTGPVPVTLDIDKAESTDEIEYKDENGVVTYTGKDGHVFSKVSESDHDIWDTKDEVYGTLVRTKTTKGVNFLVILMTNDTFKLFQETEEEWKDVTKDRHDVTKLKFFSEGDTALKRTDYDINIIDMSFSHTFKDGVKCVKVTLDNEVVWKADDDPKFPSITVFSLGVASNSFFIKNSSGEVKKIEHGAPAKPAEPTKVEPAKTAPDKKPPTKAAPAPPPSKTEPDKAPAEPTPAAKAEPTKETPTTAPAPAKEEPTPTGKSIALDIETDKGTNQFDFSEDKNIKTFTGKEGCMFDKVSEGREVVWESEGISATMIRTKLFSNGDRFLVVLMGEEFQVFRKPMGETWSDVTCERCDVKRLKFLGEGDKEITRSEYSVTLSDLSFSHMFSERVKCKKVKLGDQVVWTCEEDTKFQDIVSFSLGLVSNKFFVKNTNGDLKKLETEPKVTEVIVKEDVKKVTTPVAKVTPVKTVEPPVKKVVAEKPITKETAKPVTKVVTEPTKPKRLKATYFHSNLTLCTSDPVDPNKIIPLKCEVLEYPNPNSLLYLLSEKCTFLVFGEKMVWRYTSGPYPTSVYFKSPGLLYLNFDPYYYIYTFDGSKWVLKNEFSHRPSTKLEPSAHPKDITILTESPETTL